MQHQAKILSKDREIQKEQFRTDLYDHSLSVASVRPALPFMSYLLMTTPSQACFLWPAEEMSVEEAFGSQSRMEKLDPIRDKYWCHIDYDAALSIIRISPDHIRYPDLASAESAAKSALKAVRFTVNELVSQMDIASRSTTRMYLVQGSNIPLQGVKVNLENRSDLQGVITHQVPTLVGRAVQGYDLVENAGNSDIGAMNEIRVKRAIKDTLPGLKYARGYVRMRLHFGTFKLTTYPSPEDGANPTVDEFRGMLSHPDTVGELLDESVRPSPG